MDAANTIAKRNHLFISYASEDLVFAKWLARRLATEGYAVWMDRLKMLGGESWLVDVDEAIKSRTFRMLAIVSRNSLDKPAPRRERTFAQRLAENSHRRLPHSAESGWAEPRRFAMDVERHLRHSL